MNNWRETTLGKVANVFTGYPFKSELYSTGDQDVRLLRGDNISQGAMDWSDARKWPAEQLKDFEEYLLEEDDIVLAMDRPWIGAGLKFSQIIKSDLPALLVQRTARLRGSNDLDIGYLKYVIGSPWFSSYIKRVTTGSLVPHISLKQIRDFPVKLPLIEEQKAAAAVLLAIDKKIELNNRINTELEAMAKTLHDYWFVQFDFPDANGKPYKTSGGKMVYNPTLKRKIPDGWDVKRIGDVSQIKAGGDKPGNFSDVKTNEYMIPIFSNGVSDDGLYGFTNQSVVDQPSITVSARGTIGFSVLRTKPFVPIIRLIVLIPLCSSDINFLYESVKWIDFDNSGSVQKQLTVPQISSLNIIYPPASLREKYSSLVSSSASKIDSLKEENQSLIALRDWLLPMLMNGQVMVK